MGIPSGIFEAISASPASAPVLQHHQPAAGARARGLHIANHAEDQVIFVDLNLLPIVEGVCATSRR
jgi:hypothetical protein